MKTRNVSLGARVRSRAIRLQYSYKVRDCEPTMKGRSYELAHRNRQRLSIMKIGEIESGMHNCISQERLGKWWNAPVNQTKHRQMGSGPTLVRPTHCSATGVARPASDRGVAVMTAPVRMHRLALYGQAQVLLHRIFCNIIHRILHLGNRGRKEGIANSWLWEWMAGDERFSAGCRWAYEQAISD